MFQITYTLMVYARHRSCLPPDSAAQSRMTVIWQSTVMGRARPVRRMCLLWMGSHVMEAKGTATTVSVHRDLSSVSRCMDQVSIPSIRIWMYVKVIWKVRFLCNLLLLSGAKEAKQGCYNYNTRGVYYGFCKRPSNNQFIPCQQEWVPVERTGQQLLCSRPLFWFFVLHINQTWSETNTVFLLQRCSLWKALLWRR